MKVDVRLIGGHFAGLAWVALRTFAGTLFVSVLTGLVLAGLSYYFLHEDHWLYGAIAVAVALIEAMTIGVMLGAKRAVVMTTAHGLGALRLGRTLVRLIFERMLGVAAGEKFGERGGRVSQGLERLPFAQADELLSRAVREMMGDADQGGWLRQKVRAWLFDAVQKYTLARFREEGAKHGGIDLLKVKAELEQSVDDALVRKVRGGLRVWTALVIVGLPFAVAVQTTVLILVLHANK